ncbi:MFS transporter [Ktedonospora formicarum]|uniref:MFS transporter n=1 Tax=Ktedonospora formicarum TaxID=2778364 RepID=A0A8J3IDS3_9CHLR|nr:MFS transporter [Ktedonospora formicarum]GHO50448.1 MFS transporter [Ktedonospora formicarum]
MNLKMEEASWSVDLPAPKQHSKWEAFVVIAPAIFMANLDTSIVNVSLPAIAKTYNTSLGGPIEWVVIAYLTIIASLLLPAGWLSDRMGRKRLWITGLTVFTFGSISCGFAPTLLVLIVARGLQGAGAAFIFSIAPAILSDAFPAHERGKAAGVNAVTVALGSSTGPLLGGLLTQFLNWRWIFLINLPLVCMAVLLAYRLQGTAKTTKPQKSDQGGALLLAVMLGTLVVGLSFGESWGWLSPRLIAALTMSLGALIGLVLVERRVAAPILDASLFRQRAFFASILSLLLFHLAVFSVNVLLPFYLENLRSFPPGQVGLLLIPVPLTLAVVAPLTGRFSDRFGSASLTAGGLGIVFLGMLFLSQLDAHSSLWDIEWRLLLMGIGQAAFISPNNGAILKSSPRTKYGIAGGMLAASRVVGQSMSVSLASAVFAGFGGMAASRHLQTSGLPADTIQQAQQVFLRGLHVAFIVSAVIAVLGVIVTLGRGREEQTIHMLHDE